MEITHADPVDALRRSSSSQSINQLTNLGTPMALTVLLSGEIAGTLGSDAHGHPQFDYASGWLESPAAYPLSLSLPLLRKRFGHEDVASVLWGLLPDNENLLQRWGSHFHVSPRNPAALLAHVGEDCAGAVQFITDQRLAAVLGGADDGVVTLTAEEVAARLAGLRQTGGVGRPDDTVGHFSLAGAQSKIALMKQPDGCWAIPSGRLPTTHIIKPPSGDYDGFVENEIFCLRLARQLGLPAAHVEKMVVNGESAISVERYDRQQIDGVWHRIHQEDFCQALSITPHLKYQNQGGPGPADLTALLWAHSSQPRVDVDVLMRALMFNYLIGGTDAHAKNYSLLFGSGGTVRLAPLYDISSAFPYPSLQRRKIKMAMKVGSHYRWWDIRLQDWQTTAESMKLDPTATLYTLAEMAGSLPSAASAVNIRMRAEGMAHPVLDDLVEELHASCARLLGKFEAPDA
ncbi:MAG: type II toxin-antitoxin system HipA family toxin [Stenotrophomonas sp.]|uniref:type II toxin-antitoxin system HipA family toxin n=1 Tax=Stenotrophomonas sp. TaxID=69392 RepID=UPI0029A0C4A7|nr:type II toxin-antitoxin system HipA family toxin [Stenotrophomonas sp.]MDX3931981.1 type II toxin-antitoxin system HipA family toxin [Stenotrophomonas sp.]